MRPSRLPPQGLRKWEAAAAATGVLFDRSLVRSKGIGASPLYASAMKRADELRTASMEPDGPITSWTPEPLATWHAQPGPPLQFDAASEARAETADKSAERVLGVYSTDFLNMTRHVAPRAAAEAALLKYGCGTCGPRGFYGTLDVHLELEAKLATFLGTAQAIVYSLGLATASR